ncbi:MAG TPA: hypothetical protein PKU94_00095 [Candidatus Hydrothermia bacterium]|nr:hypothetical protein [Candidatus Hydrothermia bacterium]
MRFIKLVFTKYLKIVVPVYVVSIAIALILFYTIPRRYKATAEIMPSLEQELITTIGSALANYNPSVSMLVTPADIYSRIIQSRAVLYPVIDSLDLQKKLKAKGKMHAYKKLSKGIEVKPYSEGIIEISYEDKDKAFAAELVNRLILELDNFNKQTVMTKGKALREFLEVRLKEEENLINALMDSLKTYQKQYGTVLIEQEYVQWVQAYFEVFKNYLLKKTEYDYYKEIYSADNPLLEIKAKEVDALQEQLNYILNEPGEGEKTFSGSRIFSIPISKVPEAMQEYFGLKVKLDAHEEVFKFLFTKYEESKLLEKKDTPTFTVMRWAEVPDMKSYPRGTHLVVLFFIIGTLVNVLILVVGEVPETRELLGYVFRKRSHGS